MRARGRIIGAFFRFRRWHVLCLLSTWSSAGDATQNVLRVFRPPFAATRKSTAVGAGTSGLCSPLTLDSFSNGIVGRGFVASGERVSVPRVELSVITSRQESVPLEVMPGGGLCREVTDECDVKKNRFSLYRQAPSGHSSGRCVLESLHVLTEVRA